MANAFARSEGPARLRAIRASDDAPAYGLLAVPALAYLGFVFVVPVALLIAGSVIVDHHLTLTNFVIYLSDAHNRSTVATTLRYAFLSAAVCLLLGYPFARMMVGLPKPAELLVFAALLLPMSLSLIVRAFGWTILLGRDGPINHLLLGLHLIDHSVRLLFTQTGLLLGTVSIKLPLMILPIFLTLKAIPDELRDAGASLGAGPIYRFIRLELPLAMPGILAGFALVFAQAAAAYVLPTLLGGARLQIMSNEIVDSFLILQQGTVGSTISVLLLLIIVAVLAVTGALATRRVRA
jgi:putative spermidine/putrescine transport system permease protein